MIKLRVVGTTPDNDALVLSNKPKGRKGSHTLPVDARLIAALQGVFDDRRSVERQDLNSRSLPTAVAPPKVPPREIQRMLRAGMTVAQVARGADVPESYIEQFYPPILYEREGVIRDAQSLYTEKSRLGESGLALGEAVARNLQQRRVRMSDDELGRAWSATRREGEPWIVTLTFPFRGRAKKANWTFDQRQRLLRAANKLAIDVGWVPNGTKQVPRAPEGTSGSRARKQAKRTSGRPAKRKPTKRLKRKPAKRVTRKPARRKPTKRVTRRPAKRKQAKRVTRKPARRKQAKRVTRRPAKRKQAKRRPVRTAARKSTKRAARRSAKRTPAKRSARKPAKRKTHSRAKARRRR